MQRLMDFITQKIGQDYYFCELYEVYIQVRNLIIEDGGTIPLEIKVNDVKEVSEVKNEEN